MCPLAKIASLSALASEKAAHGSAATTVHVGRCGVVLESNGFVPPSSNFRNFSNSDNVVGLRDDGAIERLQV